MVKLKCNDGVVRNFQSSTMSKFEGSVCDTICLECNHNFSVHSWSAYKERLKKHVCKDGKYIK